MKKKISVILVILIIYIIMGAILPFMHQPVISETTKESVGQMTFEGEAATGERAYILEDNGEALKERIRMIAQAKDRVILSTFDFHSDESGKAVLSALLSAAERGVRVQILVDGVTQFTGMRGNEYFYALSDMENAEIRIYNPISLLRPWTAMGRLHDKYLIADDKLYILGGRNTYDYFLGDQPGYKNYDWDVLVYNEKPGQGESLKQLLSYFENLWNQPECKEFQDNGWNREDTPARPAAGELKSIYEAMEKTHPDWFEQIDYVKKTEPTNHIQLISNPVTAYAKEPVVFYTIAGLMQDAKEEVVFHTPYIICNDWMLEELTKICGMVPKVSMLTNSVANNGNPFGAMDYQDNKGKILATGVQILEYDNGISYHGKCFTIDDHLSAIGSFNWDMRSTYIDTELMLVIDSEAINQELREAMGSYEEKALVVADRNNYSNPGGVVPQALSRKKKARIGILRILGKPVRFLM